MDFVLNALPDDFELNALGDTERGEGVVFVFSYNLVSPAGDQLTDTAGNHLVGYDEQEYFPQILNALPDDFNLNAE